MKRTERGWREELIADSERCVKCALCLPHCPTYGLKGEEGDSPRGRIALIQALAEDSLTPSAATREHLEGCLTCRACEAVCPAGVQYGRLIDNARARLPVSGRPHPLSRLVRRAAAHPALLAAGLRAGRLLARLGLPVPGGAALAHSSRARGPRPVGAAGDPTVKLFLGCVARAVDSEALRASAALLARAGYRVEIPPGQTCCGALHMHAGERDAAEALARRNVGAFAPDDPVVGSASGCTAQLLEYDRVLGEDGGFARRVTDVAALAAAALESGRLRPDPAARSVRVALHVPCTERNVVRSDAMRRCLDALPGVTVTELPPGCCGAAGSYFLDRPDDAAALRRPLVAAAGAASADCVVTSNVGCRLHLASGFAKGKGPPVTHIATFLEGRVRAADGVN